jgi:hypothetical protein
VKAQRTNPVLAVCVLMIVMACSGGEQSTGPQEVTAQTPTETNPEAAVQTISNDGPETDPASGLIIDDNWTLVRNNCSACHSAQLVTQNRGSRQNWLDMIRWMQETQGLWPFDAETEKGILDYLEKNYAPGTVHRRVPISKSLMPENPYENKKGD